MIFRCLALVAAAGFALGVAAVAQSPDEPSEEPFHDLRAQQLDYPGPDSERVAADEVSEVLIGWFGPADPQHSLHGDLWQAASLAVEETNRDGGFEGRPFRLLPRWSENAWGTGVSQVARLAYEDQVWAILGSVDGATTHLAEQVVAKARLPLVSPVSTDPSVNLAGVPWMFSLAPADDAWAPVLAERLVAATDTRPFALVSATDHDSRLATESLLHALAQLDRAPATHLEIVAGREASAERLASVEILGAAALLVVTGPQDGAAVLSALHRRGFRGRVFGDPRLGRRHLLEAAGESADGLRVPLLADLETSPERQRFNKVFRQRTGAPPDWAALHVYDATRLLLRAIQTAGLSRTEIRSALSADSGWLGVSGRVEWDPTGQNRRPVTKIATVSKGRLIIE